MPETGKRLKCTEKYNIIIIPKKNDGIEMPTITKRVIILSEISYCFADEIIPNTTPRTEQRTKAVPERTNVADSRSNISSNTGRFKE